MKHFHLVRRQADKSALLVDAPTASVLVSDASSTFQQSAPPVPIGPALQLGAESQLGLVTRAAADEALIEAAADGVLFVLDVTFYELADATAAPSAANTLRQSQSVVSISKIDGEVRWNNATPGAFTPNAYTINAVTDNVTLSEIVLAAFNG